MVQLGKEGSMHARRQAAAVVRGDDVLHKLFAEIAERYKDRHGGYTRVLRTRIRQGDAAAMAYIEFIDRPDELRPCKPAAAPPPQRVPLPPWVQSRNHLPHGCPALPSAGLSGAEDKPTRQRCSAEGPFHTGINALLTDTKH
eukprot:TRINITY_DN4547_c0_g1_i1.p1 TRINITY_DN4547_c0_g1~~TRINITY_DN4547_c0_g1_i1.p1  ORF type:complete len:142 (-),score=23.07 TRINITY_DN4547_c0_g1_i1:216-641(-)